MQYIIILICALLSCAKVTTQGYVARENVKSPSDSVYLNCFVFAFTTLIFSFGLNESINPNIIIYAVIFGIFSSCFQIFYAMALESGPFSASCMIVNLNMVLPVAFSFFFFNEKITIIKIIGMILCIISLFLNMKRDPGNKKVSAKWIVYVLLAFFSTGIGISVTQKIFAKSQYSSYVNQFIFLGYLIAFLITLILVLFQKITKTEHNFKLSKKNIILIFVIAATLGAFQYFRTNADSFIDAIVINPSISGLATTFQMFSGRIIFKERFNLKQICSICIGIIAILLISI